MALQIYNTLTRRKEPFETIEPGVVRMYVCGVTVYDSAHVGHALSYLFFDTIRRYLEWKGLDVRYIQNFTDVDDKMIKRAGEEGVSVFELADRYIRDYMIEAERLRLKPARVYPRVSSEMDHIIDMIAQLIEGGHAYAAPNGDVYFDVSTFPDYGALSKRPLEEAESQEPPSDAKRQPADFALWKAAKPGEPSWDSPWGRGRPGWHIECSAMAAHHLGPRIDIHGGGSDLIFPHHENELAQSEACTGEHPFVRYWMHNGLLQLGEEKMSKSLGNIVSVAEFLEAHEPEALRLFVLSSHYRGTNTLTDASIAAAEKGLARLRGAMRPGRDANGDADAAAALEHTAAESRRTFEAAMDDDFGTPGALAALFDLVTAINRGRDAGAGSVAVAEAQRTLAELADVLGFDLRAGYERSVAQQAEAGPFIELLLDLREKARADKDWATADAIRDALAERGVAIEDTADGTAWRMAG